MDLERREHRFVRYADGCMIFCKSNAKREEKYQRFMRGWVNYFKLADMGKLLKETDEWARRRVRAVYWKQWKKIKTKYRMLKALGLEQWRAKELACSRKGYWRMAQVLNSVITNKIIAKIGYTSMLDYYLIIHPHLHISFKI